MKSFHLHLISDATGETIISVARAALAQFEDVDATEHLWSLIRSPAQVERVLANIEANPGVVMFTFVNAELRTALEAGCRSLQLPCIPVLDPVIGTLSMYLGAESQGRPGRQHVLDNEYFNRIDSMNFVLSHDDGQLAGDLEEADIVIIGVSRTSKTPTCFYLANRGLKAANIPIVPGVPMPRELERLSKPLIVGVTRNPESLVQIRRNRLDMLHQDEETDYVDLEQVREEVMAARRLCTERGWPVIDVSRRSIEETAAEILQLHTERLEG
jgi:[pyruvate, water dikinase]-phosphate phosphotransferase / [pyruvate, water dikinase] kinase